MITKGKERLFNRHFSVFLFLPPYFSGVLSTSVCDTMVTRLLFSILNLLQTQLPTRKKKQKNLNLNPLNINPPLFVPIHSLTGREG